MMKILIVEDDFRIGEMYREYLLKNTCAEEIYTALNATESLGLLEEKDIDLMLVDVYLPDMHGDRLIEEVLKSHPYVNFIAITASQESEKVKNMMQLGVLYYLVKPVKLDKLGETVNEYAARNRELAEPAVMDQEKIDRYFGKESRIEEDELPKGRSEEHTSELQSRFDLVCRLLLEKKNYK